MAPACHVYIITFLCGFTLLLILSVCCYGTPISMSMVWHEQFELQFLWLLPRESYLKATFPSPTAEKTENEDD